MSVPSGLAPAVNAAINNAYEAGITAGLAMAANKARQAAEEAPEWANVRDRALNILTVTDPTGHRMLPADIRIIRHAAVHALARDFLGQQGSGSVNVDAPWGVVLDWGPLRAVLPAYSRKSAKAIALAFVHLIRCDYDLSLILAGGGAE
jgi:hypothetical protein